MKKTIGFILLLLISFTSIAQKREKIRGNRIELNQQHTVPSYTTLDISHNFEIILSESSDPALEIDADSNLHDIISFEVKDSILTIKTLKDVKRHKKLSIKVKYPKTLRNITIRDKVNLTATGPIALNSLSIEANDYCKIFTTLETQFFKLITNGKSIADLHINSARTELQINDATTYTGIITGENAKIDLYNKSSAKIEGDLVQLTLRTEGDTNFYGERFSLTNASVFAEATSDVFILVNETLDVNAIDKSEVYILGTPKLSISGFDNNAIIYKKEEGFSPGLFY